MRLTNYPEVTSIRETKQITLTTLDGKGITVTIQDLPPTYGDELQAALPLPQPKLLGVLKDGKGKIERDERTGKPIMQYDDQDAKHLKDTSQIETLHLVYMVLHGLEDGQVEFETPKGEDLPAYYREVLREMKDFGLGMGQVTRIANAVRELSGITDEDVERATRDF